MIIYPAIDLKGGQCVRLQMGRESDVTVYSESPVETARRWVDAGAEWLHVVDLDGAFKGEPVHTGVIRDIVSAVNIPVQVGGGLREDDHVMQLIDAGVSRAVIGTRALSDVNALARLVEICQEKIAVGIDARDGRVQVRGWVETTDVDALELAQQLDAIGVSTLIYTDTSRDGMLTGVNISAISQMCNAVSADVVASGGVGANDDVHALAATGHANLNGVIVGKALYEGKVTLSSLIAAAG